MPTVSLPPFSPVLLTDLYELTMMQAYFEERMSAVATFSLFARRMPSRRNNLLACGLDDVLKFLETVHVDRAALGYLSSLGTFSPRFLQHLERFRFTDWIAQSLESGASIDGFGVGSDMGVSADAPTLDLVYKLVAYAGYGRMKLSAGKAVLPGRRQIFRVERDGTADRDVIARYDEPPHGRPLLEPVMMAGVRLPAGRATLANARARTRAELGRLPPHVRAIQPARTPYPIEISARLAADRETLRQRIEARHAGP